MISVSKSVAQVHEPLRKSCPWRIVASRHLSDVDIALWPLGLGMPLVSSLGPTDERSIRRI